MTGNDAEQPEIPHDVVWRRVDQWQSQWAL